MPIWNVYIWTWTKESEKTWQIWAAVDLTRAEAEDIQLDLEYHVGVPACVCFKCAVPE